MKIPALFACLSIAQALLALAVVFWPERRAPLPPRSAGRRASAFAAGCNRPQRPAIPTAARAR